MSDAPPISAKIAQNLADKIYEKRKQGALEIEEQTKQLVQQQDYKQIAVVIEYLTTNFTNSTNNNNRKGGLISLAAVAIGLGGVALPKYLSSLIIPVLKCFSDMDSKIRYFACESMYNILKIGRGRVLPHFNDIFDGMCKLAADPDQNVKNGVQLLDRLFKDIVTENGSVDVPKFIPLLQERINVKNGSVRSFLISWISVLNSVPEIELLQYLPEFLDGVLSFLSDDKVEIRREAETLLAEFLKEIKQNSSVNFGKLVEILLPLCNSSCELIQLTSLMWINEFILLGKEKLLPYSAALLSGILPCLSIDSPDVREISIKANDNLMALMKDTKEPFDVAKFLSSASLQLLNSYVHTRMAALHWVTVLYNKNSEALHPYLGELFPALLKTLSDPSEKVVKQDLEVMARISANSLYFDKMMHSLIAMFSTDPTLLETRGPLIIRQLSLFISPEKIFRTLSDILAKEEDMLFASTMVQILNSILLTAVECWNMRMNLKNLDNTNSCGLFKALYHSWCHNAAATFSLCLLTQQYKHTLRLIQTFSELDLTVDFLVEVDKLVQLLESPIFTSLRLQLLEPDKYPYLFKSLYGILMLLPQSSAFETLRTRLACVSSLGILHLIPKQLEDAPGDNKEDIDFDELLAHFLTLQRKHIESQRSAHLSSKDASSEEAVKAPEQKPSTV